MERMREDMRVMMKMREEMREEIEEIIAMIEEIEEMKEKKEIERDIKFGANKLRIHSFHGKSDIETYLDWELKIEQIFTCHKIRNDKKVNLVTLEF